MRRQAFRLFKGIGVLVAGVVAYNTLSGVAMAGNVPVPDGAAWMQPSGATIAQKTAAVPDYSPFTKQRCTKQKAIVKIDLLRTGDVNVCVVRGLYVNIATGEGGQQYFQFKNDKQLHKIYTESYGNLRLIEGTDTAVRMYTDGYSGEMMAVYTDVASRLKPSKNESWQYEFSSANPAYPENGQPERVFGVGNSRNGRFIAFGKNAGAYYNSSDKYILLDLEAKSSKAFGYANYAYTYTSLPFPSFAISDDGNYVAAGGYVNIKYWNVAGCGAKPTDWIPLWPDPCPSAEIGADIYKEKVNYGTPSLYGLQFSDDMGELSFYQSNFPNTTHITLQKPGYQPPRLEYLALGDSYSSGEGDTIINPATNAKYYRDYTDQEEDKKRGIPREKCHVSTRSYPYVLASFMKLPSTSWSSVACSGAVTGDMNGKNEGYLGQNRGTPDLTPRLKGYESRYLKDAALNELIPGRNQQIEFVKKYKPTAITLTGGGNDVGFAEVVNTCVNPYKERASTCSYVNDKQMVATLGGTIERSYTKLISLYQDLYAASGNTAKIYVLGYPLFVNPDAPDSQCQANVRLNKAERQMVQAGVTYMNDVIEAAAKSAGIKYIDVENSLEGHRLCDKGDKYMTGIAWWSRSEIQESFHPNALAHGAMALSIMKQLNGATPTDYQMCPVSVATICPDAATAPPQPPAFFASAMAASKSSARYGNFVQGPVRKGSPQRLTTDLYEFEKGSTINATVYSDAVDMGNYTASDQGVLNESIQLPTSLPAGFHTVVLSGKSYTGELLNLYQVVEVTGSNSADTDDDGVLDSQDACLYIQPSGQDDDGDSIDDACDPLIGPAKPQANGNVSSVPYVSGITQTNPSNNVSEATPLPTASANPSITDKIAVNSAVPGDGIGMGQTTPLPAGDAAVLGITSDKQPLPAMKIEGAIPSKNDNVQSKSIIASPILWLSLLLLAISTITAWYLLALRKGKKNEKTK